MQTFQAEIAPTQAPLCFMPSEKIYAEFEARNLACAEAKAEFKAENLTRTSGIKYAVVRIKLKSSYPVDIT